MKLSFHKCEQFKAFLKENWSQFVEFVEIDVLFSFPAVVSWYVLGTTTSPVAWILALASVVGLFTLFLPIELRPFNADEAVMVYVLGALLAFLVHILWPYLLNMWGYAHVAICGG